MGMAHLLGVEGATESLSGFGSRSPLLSPDQILLFAVGHDQCTEWERDVIGKLSIRTVPVAKVAADPTRSARSALDRMNGRCDRLLIHFDVDVIDFTDAPLSENTGRNIGLSFDTAMRAFSTLAASDRLSAVTVTELNPLHGAEDGSTVSAFVERLAAGLAGRSPD
jgi:arginase